MFKVHHCTKTAVLKALASNEDNSSSNIHIELIEVLSPCFALLNGLPVRLDTFDVIIGKELPEINFWSNKSFSLKQATFDVEHQYVLDQLTAADNGLIHDLLRDEDQEIAYLHFTNLKEKLAHQNLDLLEQMEKLKDNSPYLDFEESLICAALLTELSRHYHARTRLDTSIFPGTNVHYTSRRTRVGILMNYLVNHIQTVTLKSMAEHFGYQPKYLSRLIKELFDQTFSQLKQNTRIQISKSLLEATTKSVAEISAVVGYPNPNAYYYAFKRVTGMTPAEFREKEK